MSWNVRVIGDEAQVWNGKVSIRVDGYSYDSDDDYLWIGLKFRGQIPVEIKGQSANEIMTKLSIAGIKGEVWKDKTYKLTGRT